eukprot:12885808-Prorocentrum_lima.AAC.1
MPGRLSPNSPLKLEPRMVSGVCLGPTLKRGSKVGQAMHFARLDAFRGSDLRPWKEVTPDVYIAITEEFFLDVGDEWHF